MGDSVKFTARKPALDRLIRTAQRFTAQDTGALPYLRCVLLDASESGEITATAESEAAAIQLGTTDAEVFEPGRMLIRASWLATAIDVIQPDEDVTLSYEGGMVSITSTRGTDIELTVDAPEEGFLPEVGVPDTGNGIKVDPEEFSQAYTIGSGSRDEMRRYPVLTGVYSELGDDDVLRFMSSDGATSSSNGVKVERVGDGLEKLILRHDGTMSALEYMKEGQSASVHMDSGQHRRLHVVVTGKERRQLYHLRIAVLDHDVSEYPFAKIQSRLREMVASIQYSAMVDKMELLRVLDNAARFCSLNPNSTGGQAKRVEMGVSRERLSVSVEAEASYDDAIDIMSWSSDDSAGFKLNYGLFGHLIRAYPGKEKLKAGFFTGGKQSPIGLMLYTSDGPSDLDPDNLPDYLCILPIVQESWRIEGSQG